jgi:hypothetical protein
MIQPLRIENRRGRAEQFLRDLIGRQQSSDHRGKIGVGRKQ